MIEVGERQTIIHLAFLENTMKLKLLAAALAFAASTGAQAVLLIDNFTTAQTVTATGIAGTTSGSVNMTVGTDTDLLRTGFSGALRTVTANSVGVLPVPASADTTVNVTTGFLLISNNASSDGTASLLYNFDATSFTAAGTALLLNVISIDTGVAVNITAGSSSGTSTSGFQAFTGPGTFYELFSSFTGLADFTQLTSLKLDFQGVPSWDGTFQFLVTDNPPSVPEPATLGLLGLGLLGLGLSRRKRA